MTSLANPSLAETPVTIITGFLGSGEDHAHPPTARSSNVPVRRCGG
jgi:hypothetical protein